MLISELIARLLQTKEELGNVPVCVELRMKDDRFRDCEIAKVMIHQGMYERSDYSLQVGWFVRVDV